ncbi:PQQ-dependent sugar dehydrogenase [Mariniluteicoccus endophyticus]
MSAPRLLLSATLAGAVLLAACTTAPERGSSSPAATTAGPVTTTGPAATPSAPGRPPSATAASKEPTADEPVEIARDLQVPWGVALLPDGSALVTLRDSGRVLQIANGRTTDVGTVPGVQTEGEGGLHGIAVSPAFAEDHLVYVHHTSATDNRVVRLRLDGGHLVPDRVIVDGLAKGPTHNGGRIAFGPDGQLYVATGEAGDKPRSQDPADPAGKILRVTADGAPSPGNPRGDRVWSMGHRNVQGLAWRGDKLYATEFGQNTWDELNEIRPGQNYGWPVVEGMADDARYVNPVKVWTPEDASPSGMAIVGDIAYVAALRGEKVWRVDLATGEQRAVLQGHGRIRHVSASSDGRLWVVTSNTFRGEPRPGDDRILSVPLP